MRYGVAEDGLIRATISLSLIGSGLMISDVFSPKLLDGHPVTFVRAEGLNDFVVRMNSESERTISRELWCSLIDHGSSMLAKEQRGKLRQTAFLYLSPPRNIE
jgi:hypothetical protein